MTDEPWESYHRDPLRSGWSYPVGRSTVEASLRAVGVHLLSLDFAHGGGSQADTTLLRADRYADAGSTYFVPRGTPNRPRCTLVLYAVPSGVRAQASVALTTDGGLHGACTWLAGVEDANPTWLDKAHSWTAYLRNGTLYVEDEVAR